MKGLSCAGHYLHRHCTNLEPARVGQAALHCPNTYVIVPMLMVPALVSQYFFETLFPRIPKPVSDDLAAKLIAQGLPTKAVGNAGQGGGDRRGVDEPNRRPASVKVCGVE